MRETKTTFKHTKPEAKEWSPEDTELVDWFLNLDRSKYPQTPFELKPGERIVDFFTSLREEIGRGPNQYRARYGVLQEELRCLKRVIERNDNG